MDNSIWSVLDVIFVGAGFYVLYGWFVMRTKGEITTTILLNKEVDPKKCRDLEGYKAYISPKMLILGISALIYGTAGLVNTYVTPLPGVAYGIVMVLFLAVLIWFALAARKGVKKFW